MGYRNRAEITAQILETAAMGEVTKSKIMFRGYLSYAQVKEYLEVLLANGLIDYDESSQKFKTNEKGVRFLQVYRQLEELAPRISDSATS